jgi:DNA-nicking Smr family endonuclease
MKKNKDQEPGRFNHTPFKSLKHFKPAPAESGAAKRPSRTEKKEDDAELFMRAVSGIREINREAESEGVKKQPAKQEPYRGPNVDEQAVFLKAMEKIGTKLREQPEEDIEEAPRQSPSSRMKQLKRGTIRVREELDLHGCLRDEALVKLEHFLSAAYGRGQKAVLVITGKGLNSPEGPVLQGAIAGWLRQKGKHFVAEFGPAPRELGGSGAYVVFLKHRG